MKKLILCICFVLFVYSIVKGETIFSEDFTVDPGWTSTEPENIGWDPSHGNPPGCFRARVSDNPSFWPQWGYSPAFQQVSNRSFTLEFDMNPVNPSYGTYPMLGLIEEGAANPWFDRALSVGVEKADEFPQNFVIRGPIYDHSPELQVGEWYHQRLDYNAGSHSLGWEIFDSVGGLFYNAAYTNITIAPFNQVVVGYEGDDPVYGTGWAEIYVDNINIIPEPATLILLALGGIILRKSQK